MKATERIEITARAIRSQARHMGVTLKTTEHVYAVWDELARQSPETIAGQLYYNVPNTWTSRRVARLALTRLTVAACR